MAEVVRKAPARGALSSRRLTKLRLDLLSYVVLGVMGVSMLMPLTWMLITSFKPTDEVLRLSMRWYTLRPTLEHYQQLFSVSHFDRFYVNSLFVSISITVGQVLTSSLAGFAFARLSFPGREKMLWGYVATMMIPFAVRLIPTFIVLRWLGWVDRYEGLIIPLICSPYNTFLFRQFYKGIPEDLCDAAKLDGCGYWAIYRHVMLPLSRSMVAAISIITFLWSWKNFMWPLIVTNSTNMMVISVALSRLVDDMVMDWGLLMAATSLAMIPTLIVFILAQEQFIRSVTLTGIKG